MRWAPVALMAMLAASTASSQQLQPSPDSSVAQIHTTLRAFYFNLVRQDWDALTTDILAAKVVAHRPAPQALLMAATRPKPISTSTGPGGGSSPELGECRSRPTPLLDQATITLDGDWAEVSVPRCNLESAAADEFRLIQFQARWRIVYISLGALTVPSGRRPHDQEATARADSRNGKVSPKKR